MTDLKTVKTSNGRTMYFKNGKIISKEKYLQLKVRSKKVVTKKTVKRKTVKKVTKKKVTTKKALKKALKKPVKNVNKKKITKKNVTKLFKKNMAGGTGLISSRLPRPEELSPNLQSKLRKAPVPRANNQQRLAIEQQKILQTINKEMRDREVEELQRLELNAYANARAHILQQSAENAVPLASNARLPGPPNYTKNNARNAALRRVPFASNARLPGPPNYTKNNANAVRDATQAALLQRMQKTLALEEREYEANGRQNMYLDERAALGAKRFPRGSPSSITSRKALSAKHFNR